ncbi:MAG TPA: hypothetical protein VK625_18080 [Flavitalea sp.]|nr:hypothetical protein [Flavitalea sp.]
MKKVTLIQLFGILFVALLSACSTPSYLGKTYPATQNVDIYLDTADVKKTYTTMGTSTYDQGLNSLDAMQQKLIEMGKAKGADGVIMKLTEEVAVTQQSGVGVAAKKSKIVTTSSTTRDIKKKKITATFIKYS